MLEQKNALMMEELTRSEARKSLLPFVQYTTPKWSPGKIHRRICAELDDLIAGKCDRLMLLCPPQHGKSTIASKRLAAFMLGKNPDREILGISATAPLAEEFGGATRDCVQSQEFQRLFPKVHLREDSRAKGRWRTTQGGGYYSVGIGGQLFGRGGTVIIDDPFASWEDAQSELERKKVWDWYQGTLYNRIHPGMPVIVIQHRLHESDLIGNLLREQDNNPYADRWRVVKLTADLDDPPWPERYPREELERKKANSHPRQWAAMYDQNPTPEDGGEFKAAWFRTYKDPPSNLTIYITADFAVTEEQTTKADPDYTAIMVWGVDHLGFCYALDLFHDRVDTEKLVKQLVDMFERWKPHNMRDFIGESGQIRRSIEPFLNLEMRKRRIFVNTEFMASITDKVSRAFNIRALMASGMVLWPERDWAEKAKSELLKFPAGAHDDIVDACSLFGRHIDNVRKALPPPEPPPAPNFARPMTMAELIPRPGR